MPERRVRVRPEDGLHVDLRGDEKRPVCRRRAGRKERLGRRTLAQLCELPMATEHLSAVTSSHTGKNGWGWTCRVDGRGQGRRGQNT